MPSLCRPTYTVADPRTGERTSRRTRKWYGQYRDATGVWQRVPLCADKTAAQAMLTELVRKVERQRAGIIDPASDQLARATDEHIEEYRTHLTAKARDEKHISETIRLIANITETCRFRILGDLQAGGNRLEQYLVGQRHFG